jgi:hypothetical protein
MKEKTSIQEEPKKTYEKPELIDHGTVEEITEQAAVLPKGKAAISPAA